MSSGDTGVERRNYFNKQWQSVWQCYQRIRHVISSTCATKTNCDWTWYLVNLYVSTWLVKGRMQMKMEKKPQKFDKQQVRRILEAEDDFISTLFDSFEVPDSIEGKSNWSPTNCFPQIELTFLAISRWDVRWSVFAKNQRKKAQSPQSRAIRCKISGRLATAFRNHSKQNAK